jgi:hypothetical protein
MMHPEGASDSAAYYYFYPSRRRPFYEPQLVQLELSRVELGSLDQSVQMGLLTLVTDANTIAILQNLAANVIWAFGTHVTRRVRKTVQGVLRPPQRKIDVGANITTMVTRLAARGRPCRLTISETSQDGAITKVTLEM